MKTLIQLIFFIIFPLIIFGGIVGMAWQLIMEYINQTYEKEDHKEE